MRQFMVIAAAIGFCFAAPAARAGDLSAESNFIDTSNQNPTLCVHFNEALKPDLSAHYEDYVRVDHDTNIVTQVSGDNLCIGGIPYAQRYSVTLLAGLPAQNGDKLATATVLTFAPGERPALVAVGGNGLYLAKRSATGLAITSVNVKKLEIHILRLNDVNAIQDFNGGETGSSFDPAQQSINGYNLNSMLATQMDVIWSGSMAVSGQPDAAVQTLFPIATAIGQSQDIMTGKPGVYLVVAENAATAAPPGFWQNTLSSSDLPNFYNTNFATHWVIVTDLGLTAITGDDGLHVGVKSISSAAAAAGVKVNLLSQGGDILTSVTTDSSGNAVIPKALLDGKLSESPLAIAAYGQDNDFSYLPLTSAAFDLSDRGVTGRAAPVTNDAFMFGDRGIYRPGETVHATILLRDSDGKAIPNQKLSIGLVRGDTVQVETIAAQTDDAGGAVVDVPLPANALHGQWTIQTSIDPTLPPIGTMTVDVENFQPADLRVTASGAPARAAPGDKITLQATGTYLYGAPADLPVQAAITITTDKTPIPGATGYSFGLLNDTPAESETDIANNGADANGKITLQTTLPAPPATTAPLRARISIGYLEPSGAITRDVQEVKLTTTPTLIGIKPLFAAGAVDSGDPAAFDIAAFDPATGKPVAAPALDERLVRTDTVYDWVGANGSWTWRSYTVDHPVELAKLALNGHGPTAFTRSLNDGDYTLIISDPQTGAATSAAFSVGWAGIGTASATPDTLNLTADHTELQPGGTATVRIKGSFAGVADIYVANNRVYAQQTITVPKDGATATITATPDWNGGAYVIADLHRGSANAPGHASVRAIGVGWIGIDPAPHTLGVQITAPAQILPRTRQTITVKITGAAPGEKVHLVLDVVDEGILGLTKYKTPDPVGWFWGQRQLGVEIRDLFGSLLNDQGQPGSIQQGGDEGAGGPRVPLQSTRLFAVASGDLVVGADGTIQVPLDVPDFEGQARLSAIAWSSTQAGSAFTDMVVRDPVVMIPGLPNFLSAGDHAQLPVTLTNVDGPAGTYTVVLKQTGAVAKITLAAKEQKIIELPYVAGAPGVANLDFVISREGFDIDRPFSIPIRPAHPPALASIFGPVKPGGTIALPIEVQKSGAATGEARLAITTFPGLDPGYLLATLQRDAEDDTGTVGYASRAFPLLNPAFAQAWPGGAEAARGVVTNAITIIENRQDMDGNIGDWSFTAGADGFNDWTTAYAIDFLLSAKAAGYTIPQVVIDRSTAWLRSEAASLAQVVTYQGTAYGSEAPAPFPSFVYTQWLLARTGRADIGALRVAADGLSQAKSPDGHALVFWSGGNTADHQAAAGDLAKLAMALNLAGDPDRARTVLAQAQSIIAAPWQPIWSDSFWWTANQDAAIVLLAAAKIGDKTAFAKTAARIDPQALAYDQDDDAIAWLLRAIAQSNQTAGAPVQISVAGTSQSITVPGAASLSWPELIKSGSVKIMRGAGYYALTAHYVPAAPAAPFAHGMTLNAEYDDLSRKPVDLTHLKQGQSILVIISGSVPRMGLHKLNIVSLLPGCFVIQKSMPGPADYPSFTRISQPENYVSDVDRFLATLQLGTPIWMQGSDNADSSAESGNTPLPMPPGQFLVAYIVKVTTLGMFTMPEITVRDRLHPAINAGTGSRIVTVTQ